jgi:hypothetical protein
LHNNSYHTLCNYCLKHYILREHNFRTGNPKDRVPTPEEILKIKVNCPFICFNVIPIEQIKAVFEEEKESKVR